LQTIPIVGKPPRSMGFSPYFKVGIDQLAIRSAIMYHPSMTFRKIPPPGFQGLRDDLPIRRYFRRLPHWRQAGATYFVTFNLYDSLQVAAIEALKQRRLTFDHENPPPHNDEQIEEKARRLAQLEERWLDAGHGSCMFKSRGLRDRLCELFLSRNLDGGEDDSDARYALGAWTIMPNHVHVLVRPLHDEITPLEEVLRLWKGASARELNRVREGTGPVWFQESHDRIVRDTEHLWRCLQYIGSNGALAGVDEDAYGRWVCSSWRAEGWDFDG
jgi:putative transposase